MRIRRLVASRRLQADLDGVIRESVASQHPVWEYHPNLHMTRYAASMPCEDFAEVFHFYLRHKGRLPTRLANKPAIVAKWKFVEWLACRISRRHPPLKVS